MANPIAPNHTLGPFPEDLRRCIGTLDEGIVISFMVLDGAFPSFIGEFSELRILMFKYNMFSGMLDGEIFRNITNLEVLDISNNRLTGDVPIFHSDNFKLRIISLQMNFFSRVLSNAFSSVPAGSVNNSFVNLAYQQSTIGLLLMTGSFVGIEDGSKLNLKGNFVHGIPSHLFGNPSSLREGYLDFSDIGIWYINDNGITISNRSNLGLTPSGSRGHEVFDSVFVDLRGNYIAKMTAEAFGGAKTVRRNFCEGMFLSLLHPKQTHTHTHTQVRGNCVDKVDWQLNLDPQAASELGVNALTCNNFDDYLSFNCLETSHCRSLYLNEIGTGGLTVQNACCKYGGGFEYGISILMDKYSPITCRPATIDDYQYATPKNGLVCCCCCSSLSTLHTHTHTQQRQICFCGNYDDRYFVDTDFCGSSCWQGTAWIEQQNPPDGVGSQSGRCEPCEAGKFSEGVDFYSAVCTNCSVGKYTEDSYHTECLACPKGSVAESEGQTECEKCPAGKMSSTDGSNCDPCLFGTFLLTFFPKYNLDLLTRIYTNR